MQRFWTVHIDGMEPQRYLRYSSRGEANLYAEGYAKERPGTKITVFLCEPVGQVIYVPAPVFRWRDLSSDS